MRLRIRAPVRCGADRMDAMLENPVFSSFVFYSTLLILKMYTIAVITGQVRLRKKVIETPMHLTITVNIYIFPQYACSLFSGVSMCVDLDAACKSSVYNKHSL